MIQPSDLRVMIGMPAYKDIPWQTSMSLLRTFQECRSADMHVQVSVCSGSAVIQAARSDVLHAFLQSDCNRLFWIDSDMEWTAHDFGMLLALSAKPGMDVVGCTYPAKRDPITYFVKCDDTTIPVNEYGCLKVDGLGLGFTVMTREAVEAVANTKPWALDEVSGAFVREVFRCDTVPLNRLGEEGKCPPELVGQPIYGRRGEDMAFFADLRDLGYTVWLYPNIQLGHIGTKTYRGDLMAAMGLS